MKDQWINERQKRVKQQQNEFVANDDEEFENFMLVPFTIVLVAVLIILMMVL